ncbi:uncharacterized protein LOC115228165 [Octopus sinensis]|uniref:Uncharacterized protein LOC115228165 n=1 Tax=Octopus sinensis TaxID=2607531 RepID=A0A6P7TZH7_9MOLL|nr:uncharacterized protein LOC115228165 [Octopus sinensis]
MDALCTKYGIKHVRGRPRAPWVQGQVERNNDLKSILINQSIKRWISSASSSQNCFGRYRECIKDIVYDYNNSIHSSTKKIPFYIFMGVENPGRIDEGGMEQLLAYDSTGLSEARESALENLIIAGEKMIEKRKWRYDEENINVGTTVLLRSQASN